MSYWDSSALVKLYVREADSDPFVQHAASSATPMVISRLAWFEVSAAIRRKEADRVISKTAADKGEESLRKDIREGRLRLVEITEAVEGEFEQVLSRCYDASPVLLLRTLDALHLATALLARETSIVAADKRPRDAALRCGLAVFPA